MEKLYEEKAAAINNFLRYDTEAFLSHFDNIFTTNQDLLIERNFHNLFTGLLFRNTTKPNRKGTVLPGINSHRFQDSNRINKLSDLIIRVSDKPLYIEKESKGYLPYIKLHGSYNWQTESGVRLMISGGNKAQQMRDNFPLLMSYFNFFNKAINLSDTLIVSIGYGFYDTHINDALLGAFNRGAQLYVIDPRGLNTIPQSGLFASLQGKLYGIEKRTFREILTDINQAKVLFHKLFNIFIN